MRQVGEDVVIGSTNTCIESTSTTWGREGGRGEEREKREGGREGGKDWEGLTSCSGGRGFPSGIIWQRRR